MGHSRGRDGGGTRRAAASAAASPRGAPRRRRGIAWRRAPRRLRRRGGAGDLCAVGARAPRAVGAALAEHAAVAAAAPAAVAGARRLGVGTEARHSHTPCRTSCDDLPSAFARAPSTGRAGPVARAATPVMNLAPGAIVAKCSGWQHRCTGTPTDRRIVCGRMRCGVCGVRVRRAVCGAGCAAYASECQGQSESESARVRVPETARLLDCDSARGLDWVTARLHHSE